MVIHLTINKILSDIDIRPKYVRKCMTTATVKSSRIKSRSLRVFKGRGFFKFGTSLKYRKSWQYKNADGHKLVAWQMLDFNGYMC